MSDNPAKVGNFVANMAQITLGSPFRKVLSLFSAFP